MARVAIVVVTYNSAECVGACLDSFKPEDDLEIVVVDNASADDTRERVRSRDARLIANDTNRGFAAAVNQGVLATSAPLILLLNPDTRAVSGVGELAATLENDASAGAASGLLTDANGRPQAGFMYRRLPRSIDLVLETLGINGIWRRNPLNWQYRCLGQDPMVACTVEQPAGAFLMFSRQAWERVGGFNERFYPLWFEDVDFGARLKQAGLSVHYNPAASAIHEGAHSIRPLALEKRELCWYGSLLEYAAIHYGSITYRTVCFAVVAGAMFRGVRSIPRIGFKALAVYGAVCRLALGRLFRPRRESGGLVARS